MVFTSTLSVLVLRKVKDFLNWLVCKGLSTKVGNSLLSKNPKML